MPEPGEVIAGRYLLEQLLGKGGMGAVYTARHASTGRRFAVKVLGADLSGDAEAEARFFREATLASSINHPAIVEVYDVGRHQDRPYMVMKLLEGESLGERLTRGPVPADEAVAILLPVLDGVAAAHAHGILHRDLKPDNIMLWRDGDTVRPKVLDFGISKLLTADARTRLTRTGISIGTPLYMSPEQVRGDGDIDARSDVYALGVILYEMLAGTLPYSGNNYADLVVKIVSGKARPIRELDAKLSATLEKITMRAIACSRNERFAGVAQFAGELRARRTGAPANIEARLSRQAVPSASTPFSSELASLPPPPPTRAAARRAVLAGAAVAMAAGALWLLWPKQSDAGASAAAPGHDSGQRAAAALPPAKPAEPVVPSPPPAAPAPPPPPAVAAREATKPAEAPQEATPAPKLQAPAEEPAGEARKRRNAEKSAAQAVQPAALQKRPSSTATPAPRRVRSEIIDPFDQ